MILAGALAGALAVLLGAFGAHGLKERLSADALAAYETGVRYQFYHALALLLCAVLARQGVEGTRAAAICWLAGMVLFSGSIYLLSTRAVTGLSGVEWLGPITPLGGLLLTAGWILLAVAAGRRA